MASLILLSGNLMVPDPSPSFCPVVCVGGWGTADSPLIVFLKILRRALADPLRYLRELAFGNLVPDRLDVDLVPPVIAEVEPVAEAPSDLQSQRVDAGLVNPSGGWVVLAHVRVEGPRQDVPGCLRVHRTRTELELIHVLVPAVECVEDCVVQVLKGLVATDLDGAGHLRVGLIPKCGDTEIFVGLGLARTSKEEQHGVVVR